MTSLFISYSRKDIEHARTLTKAFEGKDLDFWIDWVGIPPTVDWWKEIEKGIEESDIFLFLISPDSVNSSVCRKEIAHAVANGKRLIPIVVRETRSDESPSELSSLNWIFFRAIDDFQASYDKLITAIQTDYAWVQSHRQLQVKALEWGRSNRENSFLLRGKELSDAEFQLATNTSKEPHPTDLQREYVFSSRQAADRQRRTFTMGAVVVLIALLGLGIFSAIKAVDATNQAATARAASTLAYNNAGTAQANAILAEERARIARAGELAALAQAKSQSNVNLSLLLSMEALRRYDNYRTRGVLLDTLRVSPHLRYSLFGSGGAPILTGITSLAFSPDGKMLASSSCDTSDVAEIFCSSNRLILWDVTTGLPIGDPIGQYIQEEFSDGYNTITFSSNSNTLILAANRNTVGLFDTRSQQGIGGRFDLNKVIMAFSPDGKMLAYAACHKIENQAVCGDLDPLNQIVVLDFETGQPVGRPLMEDNKLITNLAFSATGKVLISIGCVDHSYGHCNKNQYEIVFSDVKTGHLIGPPLQLIGEIVSLAPDGETIVMRTGNGPIFLWDIAAEQQMDQAIAGKFVAFSRDGNTLATSEDDGTIFLWNAKTGQMRSQLLAELPLAFSHDGQTLATVVDNANIILWDVDTGQQIDRLFAGNVDSQINTMAFSRDGKMLAAGDIDGKVILVDLSILQPLMQSFSNMNNAISRIYLHPNGKTLSSVDIDGSVLQWDMESRQQIGEPFLVAEGAIDFSPTHDILASPQCETNMDNGLNCLQSELVLWDLATGQQTGKRHKVSGSIYALSPDGKIIVSVNCKQLPDIDGLFCRQEEIRFWDAGTDQPIGQPLTSDIMFNISLAFSSDGTTLASAGCVSLYSTEGLGCAQNEIVIWNADTHEIVGKALLESVTEIYEITFSPDNNILALSSNTGILFWDVKKQQLIGQPLVGPLDTADTLAFNPDGTMLASGGCGVHTNNNDCIQGEIILWDVATRQPIGQPLRGHTDAVSSVVFGSDGKSLWSGGYDRTILFWNLDIQLWIKHACAMAGRNFTQAEWEQYFSGEEYHPTCSQWSLSR